jgi:hypothetical protein
MAIAGDEKTIAWLLQAMRIRLQGGGNNDVGGGGEGDS